MEDKKRAKYFDVESLCWLIDFERKSRVKKVKIFTEICDAADRNRLLAMKAEPGSTPDDLPTATTTKTKKRPSKSETPQQKKRKTAIVSPEGGRFLPKESIEARLDTSKDRSHEVGTE